MRWAGYDAAGSRCSGGPTTGARALMAWALEEYSDDGLRSGGIYNCRSVRGATAPSLHGEGRADDLMVPATPGTATRLGLDVLTRLGAVGDELGVQCVIYARQIYSAKSPAGRPYAGIAPHWDHLHIELTRAAARTLTLARVRLLLAPAVPHRPVTPGEIMLNPGARGPLVAKLQRSLTEWHRQTGRPGGPGTADGIFGGNTEGALKAYQAAAGSQVTGALTGVEAAALFQYDPAAPCRT